MSLNGRDIGEIGIMARMCAYYRTPTILVSGDRAACREAEACLRGVSTVETKVGLTRYSSIDRSPAVVREELAAGAASALESLDRLSPPTVDGPFELRVQLMCPNLADGYEKRGVERLDYLSVRITSDDFADLWAQRLGWAAGLFQAR
jgi:D-amino peptidase